MEPTTEQSEGQTNSDCEDSNPTSILPVTNTIEPSNLTATEDNVSTSDPSSMFPPPVMICIQNGYEEKAVSCKSPPSGGICENNTYFAYTPRRTPVKPTDRLLASRMTTANEVKRHLKPYDAILEELLSIKHYSYAWPFYSPVDPVKLGLPDYFTIVKKPMDLGTIKEKMNAGEYTTGDEFAADVRLVFSNCFLYNPASHEVVTMARKLHEAFEAKFAKVTERGKSVVKTHSISSGRLTTYIKLKQSTDESEDENQIKMARLQIKMNALKEQIQVLLKEKRAKRKMRKEKKKKEMAAQSVTTTPSSATPPPPKRTKNSALALSTDTPVKTKKTDSRTNKRKIKFDKIENSSSSENASEVESEDEDCVNKFSAKLRQQLCLDIKKLPEDKLSIVAHIIRSGEPATSFPDGNEMSIDFTILKPSTVRELEGYVTSCLGKKPWGSQTRKRSKTGTGGGTGGKKRKLKNGKQNPAGVSKNSEKVKWKISGGGGVQLSDSSSSAFDSDFCPADSSSN